VTNLDKAGKGCRVWSPKGKPCSGTRPRRQGGEAIMAAAQLCAPTPGAHHPAWMRHRERIDVTDRCVGCGFLVCLLACGGPAKTGVDLKSEAIASMMRGISITGRAALTWPRESSKRPGLQPAHDRREGIAANLNNLGGYRPGPGDWSWPVRRFQEAWREPGTERPRRPRRDTEQPGPGLSRPGPPPGGQRRLPGGPGSGPAAAPGACFWP